MRVLIVDDDSAFRLRLRAELLADGDRFDVVGEAANGREALDLVEALGPELVLMDLRMPVMDGREATSRIAELRPGTTVVVVSGMPDEDRIPGVSGHIDKLEFSVTRLREVLDDAPAQ